jgi:putative transposase
MSKRRTAAQIQRCLREADRDLAKGLTVLDVCRKLGVASPTYYRWRRQYDPAQVDDAHRVGALESEVERLKRLVAELMLDKQMLQDVAKKSGDSRPATRRSQLPPRTAWSLPAAG